MKSEEFVPTSVARRMISRMQSNHEKRRISVFAGPPGIGKTTAIDVFRARNPSSVVVLKIARRNAKEVLVLQHMLEGARQLGATTRLAVPSSIWELRSYLLRCLCEWAGLDFKDHRSGEPANQDLPPISFVIDEAQNLSRDAIEVLRFWNDTDRCYGPFPVGLVLVGNSEFSLAANGSGESVISAAVADRALYLQEFGYDDVTDDDLRLFLAARGVDDPDAVAAIVRSLKAPRSIRSLRRVLDLIGDLNDFADGRPITAGIVREALQAV